MRTIVLFSIIFLASCISTMPPNPKMQSECDRVCINIGYMGGKMRHSKQPKNSLELKGPSICSCYGAPK